MLRGLHARSRRQSNVGRRTLAPLSAISLGSVAPQDAAAASGISKMMRNLGGAVGTALLATIVTKVPALVMRGWGKLKNS
jgi:hypothetical protein